MQEGKKSYYKGRKKLLDVISYFSGGYSNPEEAAKPDHRERKITLILSETNRLTRESEAGEIRPLEGDMTAALGMGNGQ